MSKINLLDKKVYNRIAAGEVVERPFSVVKELVENSIDSDATEVTVVLEDGGKKLISVSDNGCGIEGDDLVKALMPHATSKIATAEDLDKITTLGFRGEALASIASVSHLTLLSKTADSESGNTIKCDCGEIGDVTPYPVECGTTVKVEDLFCNTPARAKFLKPSKSEETDILNIVTRLIFAHPKIAFKLISDGKEIAHSYGGDLDEAIIEVYGYETLSGCLKIDTVKNGIHLYGYIGSTNFVKPNRTYQTIILNGRYVVNATVSSAVHNAYAPYLMKRRYPFYILLMEMLPEFVDVNVHPNKTDVRFVDNQVVYSTVYSIISKVLEGSASAIDVVKDQFKTDFSSFVSPIKSDDDVTFVDSDKPVATRFSPDSSTHTSRLWTEGGKLELKSDPAPYSPSKQTNDSFFNDIIKENNQKYFAEEDDGKSMSVDDIFAENKRYLEELAAKMAAKSEQEKIETQQNFRVVGQVLKTYLVLECGEDIYFVDQHAAHERLLFDKLAEEFSNGKLEIQNLLVPYKFPVNGKESEFLIERLKDFRDMGIDINEYDDGEFVVYALPLSILDMDLKEFFDDVLSDLSFRQITIPELIRDKLAKKACKAAIKSGKTLSQSEIDALLEKMKGDMGLKCPHGRPVAIKITRTEIDKWFKRIV